ncbi:F-box/kelch-repeat protein At3g06240-like [Hibiscus syriacus]|uniref:F-box/kelch-repeat protein At3g06240-like n=1 Tax=Hibiscus syriacus TaxID=106335 RepID=UPI001923F307|nr:F-box/kelch-repeat protein At3g06240-like [Hibiscus syriacus]
MVVLDILSNLHVKSLTSFSIEKGQNFTVKHNIHLPVFEHCRSVPAVSGPCNGLVCLKEDKVSLWNPSARELKILPISSVSRPPLADFTSFDCLGFGFDSQIDDYKVVRFVTNYFEHKEDVSRIPDWNHQVELYSLKSDSWKEIPAPDIYPYDGPPEFNIYIDGCYYWQASGNFDYLFLSFHMVNEKFSTLPLPEFGRFFVGQVFVSHG